MSSKYTFQPEYFLDLASQLLSDKNYDQKSRSRTVVGRAYYAAFLEAKRKLASLGVSFDEVDRIHSQVVTELTARRPDLGDQLESLRLKRVDADYYLVKDVGKTTGAKSIQIATILLRELRNLK